MRRDLQISHAALDAEKAAVHHAHTFQTGQILLDVGESKFTTLLQSLRHFGS
jgi:hypothetical protein